MARTEVASSCIFTPCGFITYVMLYLHNFICPTYLYRVRLVLVFTSCSCRIVISSCTPFSSPLVFLFLFCSRVCFQSAMLPLLSSAVLRGSSCLWPEAAVECRFIIFSRPSSPSSRSSLLSLLLVCPPSMCLKIDTPFIFWTLALPLAHGLDRGRKTGARRVWEEADMQWFGEIGWRLRSRVIWSQFKQLGTEGLSLYYDFFFALDSRFMKVSDPFCLFVRRILL